MDQVLKEGRLIPSARQKPTYYHITSSNQDGYTLALNSSFPLCHPCNVGHQLLPGLCKSKHMLVLQAYPHFLIPLFW